MLRQAWQVHDLSVPYPSKASSPGKKTGTRQAVFSAGENEHAKMGASRHVHYSIPCKNNQHTLQKRGVAHAQIQKGDKVAESDKAGLDIVDRVRGLHIQGNRLASGRKRYARAW
jgi:hypothetical protein